MTNTRDAWIAVGDQLNALGLKLKLHAEEELSDDDVTEQKGLDRLGAIVKESFDALGEAVEDEAVRGDLRKTAQSFINALETTARNITRS
jgi:hypothetical protein